MTRREAAVELVNMVGIIRRIPSGVPYSVDYSTVRKLNEAVALACGELMVDDILDRKVAAEEGEISHDEV